MAGEYGGLKVFISHSNKDEDYALANQIISDLEEKGIKIVGQSELIGGKLVVQAITKLIDEVDKQLLVLSKNSIDSAWCSFELLISLEKSQRTNQLGVVLLLNEIEECHLPHIAVLQEAPKIHYSSDGRWIMPTIEALKDKRTVGDIMPAGNLAHGLVWSHYTGLLQYVLPDLKERITSSEWFKKQTVEVQNRVSFKLHEMLPRSCTVKFDLGNEENIDLVTTLAFEYVRAGSHRVASLKMYRIKDSSNLEEYYCVVDYPHVLTTIKKMEEENLANFTHVYPDGEVSSQKPFTIDDMKLQLGRFYYTLNSIINHFERCVDTTKILPFNEDQQSVSEVLIDALKEEFCPSENAAYQIGARPPKIEKFESSEVEYSYQVYVAFTAEDHAKGQEIIQFLKSNGVNSILEDDQFLPGCTWSQKMVEASMKCRWFILLMTKSAEKDKSLTFHAMSALGDSFYNKRVKVIPVVDRKEHLYIPELLRWITYIPYDDDRSKKHLTSLLQTVTGQDIRMETQLLLPAGDVAYGLAWNYVTNYLMKILPDAVQKIMEAFKGKGLNEVRCPRKLFLIIPKSCSTGEFLKDKHKKIESFSVTGEVFPFGPNRSYTNTVYKVDAGNSTEPGLYFAGQYAAPATCLEEMQNFKIGGVNEETKASEAKRFYEFVCFILEKTVPEKAKFCELIYFNDDEMSLSDIMEQKIKETEPERV